MCGCISGSPIGPLILVPLCSGRSSCVAHFEVDIIVPVCAPQLCMLPSCVCSSCSKMLRPLKAFWASCSCKDFQNIYFYGITSISLHCPESVHCADLNVSMTFFQSLSTEMNSNLSLGWYTICCWVFNALFSLFCFWLSWVGWCPYVVCALFPSVWGCWPTFSAAVSAAPRPQPLWLCKPRQEASFLQLCQKGANLWHFCLRENVSKGLYRNFN